MERIARYFLKALVIVLLLSAADYAVSIRYTEQKHDTKILIAEDGGLPWPLPPPSVC